MGVRRRRRPDQFFFPEGLFRPPSSSLVSYVAQVPLDAKIGLTAGRLQNGLTVSGLSSGDSFRAASFRLHLPSYIKRCPVRNISGGAEEIRTPDLRLAKAALSQLSYGPFRAPWAISRDFPHLSAIAPSGPPTQVAGGPWWTRTTGLGLIRTAL